MNKFFKVAPKPIIRHTLTNFRNNNKYSYNGNHPFDDFLYFIVGFTLGYNMNKCKNY